MLFPFDFCSKSMQYICDGVNESDASVWHSRLCHPNFGDMSRLSNLNLILNLSIVKCSTCHSCVQSKQHRNLHKAAEEIQLAPLKLTNSNLCGMNGILTKGGKRYFMNSINDAYKDIAILIC